MVFNGTGFLIRTLGMDVIELGAIACSWSLTCFTLHNTFYNVKKGHNAIIYSHIFGTKDKVYRTGWHTRIPFIEKPVIYNVRASAQSIESTHYLYQNTTSGGRDPNKVKFSLQVLTRPVPEKLPRIHKSLGENYKQILRVFTIVYLEEVVARYNADQLINNREVIGKEIKEAISLKAAEFNILVHDVSITGLVFDKFTSVKEPKNVVAEEAARSNPTVTQDVDKAKIYTS